MKQGMWMKANGESSYVAAKNGKDFSLEELQRLVGGPFERVAIKGGEMWVNEEGLLKGLPINWNATKLFEERWGSTDSAQAYRRIVGDVLVTLRKKKETK